MIQIAVFLVCLIVFVGVSLFIQWLIDLYHKYFRKNCFECKHWDLYDVASFGNGVRYKCSKTGYKNPCMIDCNLREYWMKCDEFEKE